MKSNKIVLKESEIEKEILDYLASRGGLVLKIHSSGKPIKIKGKLKLIPFRSKYYRKGMSDIFYVESGILYCFEVKTVKEHNYIKRNIDEILKLPEHVLTEKHKHIIRQNNFINDVIRAGAFGCFVSSIEDVIRCLP